MSAKTAARTVTRDAPENRTPDRAPERDNVIRNRAGQPVSLKLTGNEDMFAFDRSIIPDGWDYQWKVKTVKNWEWTEHQVTLAANGWEPVPADRHDGVFMPRGFKGNIERGGQILMERDIRLTQRARAMEKNQANDQLHMSRSMAGLASRAMPGGSAILDYEHPAARGASGVKIERQARVNDANYRYQIDEE